MKYQKIREEELKNKVANDWFSNFDTTQIIGNLDFCVAPKITIDEQIDEYELDNSISLLWAEAKTGNFDLYAMFAQLVITIGKSRVFDRFIPPSFLAVFDFKKIVFVPYNQLVDIFLMNDFNWNTTPSNHQSKEFLLIKSRIEDILQTETYYFDYLENAQELEYFIQNNLAFSTQNASIHIDKNNFVSIYLRWLLQVKPYINFDWEAGKKQNILDSDFFIADLFVDDKGTADISDDTSIKDDLFVVFKNQQYQIAKENLQSLFNASVEIQDKNQYQQFWKKYKRPPVSEFHQYIIDRRDLLIPQDIRERKGAFFTPRIWVELSQNYLAETLGKNWQDEYYVWDCAAGTGNLLVGLTNKYNIYASTLDMADVNVMQDRIKNGALLLEDHVFQFDFLNDDFSKLPKSLQNIINDEEKRKKLVVYMNPPYAEAANAKTITGTGENKENTSIGNKTHIKYKSIIGNASNELFTQFLARVYAEIPSCKIANFSTLKTLQSSNFKDFRAFFIAKLESVFLVPANSFDNVKGKFPIGFFIWNSEKNQFFNKIKADVYNLKALKIGTKEIKNFDNLKYINSWYKNYYDNNGFEIGVMNTRGNDFQNQNYIRISSENNYNHTNIITLKNLIETSIYISVRHCIKATWLNDRDQFLYPKNGWKKDFEFQNDCLTFTLFDNCNNIQSKNGINHWIPFTEAEVDARRKFESSFMTDFMNGKTKPEIDSKSKNLFSTNDGVVQKNIVKPLEFSAEATAVFDAGRVLWKYYHTYTIEKSSAIDKNVNASLYEIREYFQGRNGKGRMNPKSNDQQYNELMTVLRSKLNILAKKIAVKVYEYEFLK